MAVIADTFRRVRLAMLARTVNTDILGGEEKNTHCFGMLVLYFKQQFGLNPDENIPSVLIYTQNSQGETIMNSKCF